MTTMDLNMAPPLGTILLIIFGIVSIAALLGNGFIIVVNSHSWWQSRKLLLCDLLLICLGIFRFLMQIFTLLGQYIYFSRSMDFECSWARKVIDMGWIYSNMANALSITCLIVFYCVKVTTFAHPLFLWLKSRIERLVPRLLGISFIIFVLVSISPVVHFWTMEPSCNLIRNLTANTSHTEGSEEALYASINPLQFSFSVISFIICLTASILLLASLWRHTRNLKKSGTGTKDFSTQAHINVIKQLTLFLFFYILYFVSIVIAMNEIFIFGTAERLISDTVLSLYPFAHSVVLIQTNPKLKRVCACILPNAQQRKIFVKSLPGK